MMNWRPRNFNSLSGWHTVKEQRQYLDSGSYKLMPLLVHQDDVKGQQSLNIEIKSQRTINSHDRLGTYTQTLGSIPVVNGSHVFQMSPLGVLPVLLCSWPLLDFPLFFQQGTKLFPSSRPHAYVISCILYLFPFCANHGSLPLSSNVTSWPTCASISVPFKCFTWSAEMIFNFDCRGNYGDTTGGKRSFLV